MEEEDTQENSECEKYMRCTIDNLLFKTKDSFTGSGYPVQLYILLIIE